MSKEFKEKSATSLADHLTSLESALAEYDRFIFASYLMSLSGIDKRKQIKAWCPGIHQEYNKYTLTMNRYQDYDSFDIDNFYMFCDSRPMNPTINEYRFEFCQLERSESLEQLIIGSWIKNHIPFQDMKMDFTESCKQ